MNDGNHWATFSDIDKMIRLRFAYFADEKWPITQEQRVTLESSLRAYLERHLEVDFFAALVFSDGQIAATAFLSIFERPANPAWPTGKTGTIYNVFTYPEYRRHGYATSAMHMLLSKASEHQLSYIDLSASEMGLPLYRKLGFTVVDHSTAHFVEMKLALLQ